jgi:hypothetical protein
MAEQELSDFFAHIDEISQDSSSLDHFQLLQKYRNENLRLVQTLSKIRESTKGLLDILKEERRAKLQLQQQYTQADGELKVLQIQCDNLERTNVNSEFSYKEKIDELEQKHQSLMDSKQELAKDYFDVLEEATMFHNFEIKRERTRIVNKASSFLKEVLGDKFTKPHLVSKRSNSDGKSKRKRGAKNEEAKPVVEPIIKSKRRKVDIFEMQSISEVSSPASFYDEGADMGEDDSAFTYNTFSIGNETSYTLLQSNKMSTHTQTFSQCRCHLDPQETELVSIGVNTDEISVLPSVPSLSDEDFVFDQDVVVNSTINDDNFDIGECVLNTRLWDLSNETTNNILEPIECEVQVSEDVPTRDVTPTGKINAGYVGDKSKSPNFIAVNEALPILSSPPRKQTRDQGTSYESTETNQVLPALSASPRKETRDQSTTCEPLVTKSDKSTITVRSLTHRGTMTPAVVSRNFGMQFPDITFDKILEEMEFDVPDCLSPIKDFEKVTRETQTDLQNVNRELCSNEVTKNSLSAEEQSFVVLGQTIFNLFLNRLKENNKAVDDDDARTREKLWQFLRQQYLDRFDELTFDEYFSTSFVSDSESHENVCSKAIENVIDIKDTKNSMETIVQDGLEWQIDLSDCSSQRSSKSSEDANVKQVASFEDLAVSSSSSSEKECEQKTTELSPIKEIPDIPEFDEIDEHIREVEEILKSIECLGTEPVKLISPILEFEDFMWSSIFPSTDDKIDEDESPKDDELVLDGFDVDFEPVEIPTEFLDSPDEPPPTAVCRCRPYEPQIIPLQNIIRTNLSSGDNIISYNRTTRFKLVTWQQLHTISTKNNDKMLCKVRKLIKTYLESDWTDENLATCVEEMNDRQDKVLLEAIYETMEDNLWDKEINSEFTPPAPPLPRYQQKLILLISKLAETSPQLPHLLMADLEMKLFKLETSSANLDHLRNVSYYYTALLDLFFEGNSTMAFYFIVKCMYFYGYKAIPMAFVVIKAFPLALPKKSLLIQKYNDATDWENLSGLEMSKIRLDLDWVDSLDLCVMYLLTNIQMYRKKGQEFKVIYEHELFNYVPKYYGFALNFLSSQKLVEIMMKRIESGQLENISFALILLGKRMSFDFTIKTLMRGHLLPLLNKYVTENIDSEAIEQSAADKICLLIEVISSILKPLSDERDKSFKEIFPMIVNILGRSSSSQQIQECCIKAILRLQRFIQNHKEIFEIIKHRYERGESFSETLGHAISTFIHRKNEVYFKN